MRRYLDPQTPTPSGRYGLALAPVLRTELRTVREAPLEPAAAAALQTWTEPRAVRAPLLVVPCCPVPAPIAPSDATEWVW